MKRHLMTEKRCIGFPRLTKFLTAFFLLISFGTFAQDITVSGTITGDTGTPLSGVSVSVKGTTRGTSTNNEGKFTLLAPSNGTLVISSVGYTNQEIKVGGKSDISVSLVSANRELEQVVVIGYGTASKR
ncbi:MAG: SusC/RagA family TonB-linked outer membrane protein, partial [Segetibacter sp.]|nr:SusC/RagA family TonB-linked outer membrane protein [Segetibacter sp.]